METLFRKYFWTIQIVVLALSAALIGAGVTRMIAAGAADLAVTVPPAGEGVAPESNENLVARAVPENAFPIEEEPVPINLCADVVCEEGQICNSTTGECEEDLTAEEEEAAEIDEGGPCVDTSLAMVLSGTMVSDAPNWSIAVLHNPSTNKTEFARLGTEILGQAEVIRIQRNRVLIDRGGTIECLRPAAIREAAQARQQEQPAAQPSARNNNRNAGSARRARANNNDREEAEASGSSLDRVRQGVSRTGEGEYSIERATLNQVLQDQSALREQAPRVQPHYRDGQPNGFRLNGIRSDSIFSAIGIRNGDIIHSVNGQVVDSPQRAMQLYQSLMSSSRVELTVERRGQRETLVYTIQ